MGSTLQSVKMNYRRLHNVKTYLKEFLGISPKNILGAIGDRVNGQGRLEIYVEGKLVEAFGFGKGEDFYVGTCENDPVTDNIFLTGVEKRIGCINKNFSTLKFC